jgi:hypothetical protein
MLILDQKVATGRRPLHVLIIVVGNDAHAPLRNSEPFCQSICDFWEKHDDASLANGMQLCTIDVFGSDPDSTKTDQAVTVTCRGISHTVESPSCETARKAIRDWCVRVAEGGAGVLHWIGHGHHRMQEGGAGVQILYADDMVDGERSGINWSATLHGINKRIDGQPVYCFIDCCRSLDASPDNFHPSAFDGTVPAYSRRSAVVYGAAPKKAGFWDDLMRSGKDRAAELEFGGGAVATSAFLKGFEGVGAENVTRRSRQHVRMNGIAEGARVLICRWMHAIGSPVDDLERNEFVEVSYAGSHPIMLETATPRSVVDILSDDADRCALEHLSARRRSDGIFVPNSTPSKFEFILSRGDYEAHMNDHWGPYIKLLSETISVPHQEVEVSR